ncbi:MAG: sporulation integral membrane protein YlbJ [Christensenellales bacterium]|jgi:sporulation integral membrane protein YlbJ
MKKSFIFLSLLFAITLAAFPQACAAAAKEGLELFLYVVLPSLLPFFIASSLLLSTGVLHTLSRYMQPLMRPLFRCPGDSAYVFALSIVSGYPLGAKLTAQLVEDGRLSVDEALRTLSFSSTSGPLFVLGAVATGMLNSPGYGLILLLSHYAGAILTGLFYRLLPAKKPSAKVNAPLPPPPASLPMGTQLKNAVADSIKTIWMVGGYIILFCVLLEILSFTGTLGFLGTLLTPLFRLLGFSESLSTPFLSALVEITAGCKAISQASAPLLQKVILCCGAISWSGLAIHSQATAFLSSAKIPPAPYIAQKALHGAFSVVVCILLAHILPVQQSTFVFQNIQPAFFARLLHAIYYLGICLLIIIILCVAGIIKQKARKKTKAG